MLSSDHIRSSTGSSLYDFAYNSVLLWHPIPPNTFPIFYFTGSAFHLDKIM